MLVKKSCGAGEEVRCDAGRLFNALMRFVERTRRNCKVRSFAKFGSNGGAGAEPTGFRLIGVSRSAIMSVVWYGMFDLSWRWRNMEARSKSKSKSTMVHSPEALPAFSVSIPNSAPLTGRSRALLLCRSSWATTATTV